MMAKLSRREKRQAKIIRDMETRSDTANEKEADIIYGNHNLALNAFLAAMLGAPVVAIGSAYANHPGLQKFPYDSIWWVSVVGDPILSPIFWVGLTVILPIWLMAGEKALIMYDYLDKKKKQRAQTEGTVTFVHYAG
ncbi:hypothetical protein [Caballeronia telluris]|uniref:Uncharacterized protein n=1 Tax=Caballeronia telluris TaxID=326475 RepID=A0A158G000_9BURK|nr:hypothetical protein [Caballeronia telluris]SAL25424.1 hypothetical protein AWB66_01455 [Caballeronia telluris]